MQLSETSIDQHESWKLTLFVLKFGITALNHLTHGGKIVVARDGSDDELAVVRLLHFPVFPHDQASHFVRALNVRNIKAFDAARGFGQVESVLQSLLNSLRTRLHDP